MLYKLCVYCPDLQDTIQKIIDAASQAGAGVIGNYTHCAFVSHGTGQWKPGKGAHPAIGSPGTLSMVAEAKIEMKCPEECTPAVDRAVRAVHPYEEPAIEWTRLEKTPVVRTR